MIPSKKELEIILSAVQGFEEPKPELEQYMTPSDIAATLLWHAHMSGDIKDKVVLDLGCGTGILSIGASLLGAKKVYAFDIDNRPLDIAKENVEIIKKTVVDIGEIEWNQKEIGEVSKKGDTVVMNPPFGIQTKRVDRFFLEKAFEIAETVYSIHSAGSSQFLQKFAEEHKFQASLFNTSQMILKHTMPFHEKEKHPINVELWKYQVRK